MDNNKKICFIVSSPLTIKAFLTQHLNALSKVYHVTIIVNANSNNNEGLINNNIEYINLEINREIDLMKDIIILFKLISIFRKEKFHLIHSVTPKAGLLAMLAGAITRVPVRIHIFTGQVWANRTGVIRFFLKWLDKLISFCGTNILADSDSQMKFLITERVISSEKISVLANGSISGVDINKFMPDTQIRKVIRDKLNIAATDIVFLFIGRLKRDKGVIELCTAFKKILENKENSHLLLIGPDEERLIREIKQLNILAEKLHIISYTDEPEKYMAVADILCLPSYREGFGSVIIEAAACGIPAIGSRIYGITDAISENETGLLFDAGDVDALALAMKELYSNEEERKNMGVVARNKAINLFSSDVVTAAWLEYYAKLI